eukprot:2924189-Prymnesium_polylepis.1
MCCAAMTSISTAGWQPSAAQTWRWGWRVAHGCVQSMEMSRQCDRRRSGRCAGRDNAIARPRRPLPGAAQAMAQRMSRWPRRPMATTREQGDSRRRSSQQPRKPA